MRKLTIATLLLVLIACAGSAFNAASARYNAEALDYKSAGDTIARVDAARPIARELWTRFEVGQAEVRRLDTPVFQMLTEWRDSGRKPDGYDEAARLLREAQQRVIDLAKEVQP